MGIVGTTADVVAAAFLVIILIGIYSIDKESTPNTRSYKFLVWICLMGLIADAMPFGLQQLNCNDAIIAFANYIAYVLFDFIMAAYGLYLVTYIEERKGRYSRIFWRTCICLSFIDFLYSVIGTATGWLFTVKNGEVSYGVMGPYSFVIPSIFLAACVIYLYSNKSVLGLFDIVIFASYFFLQLPTVVFWLVKPLFISGYVGGAISLSVIFVLIQYRVIAKTRMEVEIFNRISVRDTLTEVKNRRGYEEFLKSVLPDTAVCAIFCDVNSLKYTNDNFGHEEGDKLIKRTVGILKNVCADDEIFRISGDEFVVIIQIGEGKTVFEKIENLKQIIDENDRIASIGYSMGEGRDINQVIKEAEQMMYLDKEDYYSQTGKDRRGAGRGR